MTFGLEIDEVDEATLRSHAVIHPIPAPAAKPFTAEIVTCGISCSRTHECIVRESGTAVGA